MRKILVPVDASESALHAARYAAKLAGDNPAIQLHVLNVQEPLEVRSHAYISQPEAKTIQAADSQAVMQPVMELLDDAGIAYRADWRAGDIAPTIAAYAEEIGCESIIMGTRGLGPVGNLVMGSVANKVVHLVNVPVTLVK
ncbi:universal stress protein [Noviherbaspirillum sp. ST9]|uniref:universal stress protein n=1 Tax=Noviherbaspirillum sp. ST9 TaxID=3401606 RepID=UPI003B58A2BA